MGYYTEYEIEAYHKSIIGPVGISYEEEAAICNKLCEISGYHTYGQEHTFENFCQEEMKWYEHDHDMIELSKAFPDIFFVVSGVGEEHDDQWRAYYHNGIAERINARIVFDPPKNEIFIGL